MIFGRPATDYFFIFLLWVLGIAYTAIALTYSPEARIVPLLVGFPIVVLTSIDLVSMTQTNIGRAFRRLNAAGAPEKGMEEPEPFSKHLLSIGLVVGFLALFLTIGAIPATAVYIATSMRVLGGYKFIWSTLTGVIVAAASYGIFEALLRIDLYKGVFG